MGPSTLYPPFTYLIFFHFFFFFFISFPFLQNLIMATAMRGLISSSLRRGVVRSFSSSSDASLHAASGARASLPIALGAGALFAGVATKLGVDHFPRFPLAKCETKMDQLDAPPPTVEADADATSSSADATAGATSIRSRADELYSAGRLSEAYELLNENPATKEDAALLFRLAQTTHKLSLASPQPERRRVLNDEALLIVMKAAEEAARQNGNKSERADILALYGAVIQRRAHRKQGAEKKQLMALAQEHMTAALREDAVNFNANYALAELHYELAQERTELGRKSLSSLAIFDKTNNQIPRRKEFGQGSQRPHGQNQRTAHRTQLREFKDKNNGLLTERSGKWPGKTRSSLQ